MARQQGLNNLFSSIGSGMQQGGFTVDPREQVSQQAFPINSGVFGNFSYNVMPQPRPFQFRPMFNQFQARPMFNPYQPRPMFGGFNTPAPSFGGFGFGGFGGFQPYQQRPMFGNFGGGMMNPFYNFAMNTTSFRGQNPNMMSYVGGRPALANLNLQNIDLQNLQNQQNQQAQQAQGYDYTQFANPGQTPTV